MVAAGAVDEDVARAEGRLTSRAAGSSEARSEHVAGDAARDSPSARFRLASFSAFSRSRPMITTWAPQAARARHMAAPRTPLPPVTTATLPFEIHSKGKLLMRAQSASDRLAVIGDNAIVGRLYDFCSLTNELVIASPEAVR